MTGREKILNDLNNTNWQEIKPMSLKHNSCVNMILEN